MSNSYSKALPRKAGRSLVASTGGTTLPVGTLVSLVEESNDVLVVNKTTASTIPAYMGVIGEVLSDGTVKVIREGNALLEGALSIPEGTKVYIDELGLYALNRTLTNICIGTSTGDTLLPEYNVVLHNPINDIRYTDFSDEANDVSDDLTKTVDDLSIYADNINDNANTRVLKVDWNADTAKIDNDISDLLAVNTTNTDVATDNSARISALEGNLTGAITVSLAINNETKVATVGGTTTNVAESSKVRLTFSDDDGNSFTVTDIPVDADGNFSTTTPIGAMFFGNVQVASTVTDIYGNLLSAGDNEVYVDVSGALGIDTITVNHGWGHVSITGGIDDHDGSTPITVKLTDNLGTSVTTTTPALSNTYNLVEFSFRDDLNEGKIDVEVSSVDIHGNPIITGTTFTWSVSSGSLNLTVTTDMDVGKFISISASGDLKYPSAYAGNNTMSLVITDKNGTTVTATPTAVSPVACEAFFDNQFLESLAYGTLDIVVTATDYFGNTITATTTNLFENTGPADMTGTSLVVDSEAGVLTLSESGKYIPKNTNVAFTLHNPSTGVTKTTTATYSTLNGVAMNRVNNVAGNFSLTYNELAQLGNGDITISYTITDYFGRDIIRSHTFNYEQPGILIIEDFTVADDSDTVTVSGTSVRIDAGVQVKVEIYEAASNDLVKTVNATVAGDGTWATTSVSIASADFGTLRAEAEAVDIHGGIRVDTATDVYDDVHGVLTIGSLWTDNADSALEVTMSFSNVIDSVDGEIDIVSSGTDTKVSYTFSHGETGSNVVERCDISALPYGAYTVTVKLKQPSGDWASASYAGTYEDWTGEVNVTTAAMNNADSTVTVSGDTVNVTSGKTVQVAITDLSGDTITRTTTVNASGNWNINDISIGSNDYGTNTIVASTVDRTNATVTDTTTVNFEEPGYLFGGVFTVNDSAGTIDADVSGGNFAVGGNVTLDVEDIDGNKDTYTSTWSDNGDGTVTASWSNLSVTDMAFGTISLKYSSDDIHGVKRTLLRYDNYDSVNGTLSLSGTMFSLTHTWAIVGNTTNVAAGTPVTVQLSSDTPSDDDRSYTTNVSADGTFSVEADVSWFSFGEITATAGVEDLGGNPVVSSMQESYVAMGGSIVITSWEYTSEYNTHIKLTGTSDNIADPNINVRIGFDGGDDVSSTVATASDWTITLEVASDNNVAGMDMLIEAWADDYTSEEQLYEVTAVYDGQLLPLKSLTASLTDDYEWTCAFALNSEFFYNSPDYDLCWIGLYNSSGAYIDGKSYSIPKSTDVDYAETYVGTLDPAMPSGWYTVKLAHNDDEDETVTELGTRTFYFTQAPVGSISITGTLVTDPWSTDDLYHLSGTTSNITDSTLEVSLQYKYSDESTWALLGTATINRSGSSWITGDAHETDAGFTRFATPDAHRSVDVRAIATVTDLREIDVTDISSSVTHSADLLLPTDFHSETGSQVTVSTSATSANSCNAILYYRWWLPSPGNDYTDAGNLSRGSWDTTRTFLESKSVTNSAGRVVFDGGAVSALHAQEDEQGSAWKYEVVLDGTTLVSDSYQIEDEYTD